MSCEKCFGGSFTLGNHTCKWCGEEYYTANSAEELIEALECPQGKGETKMQEEIVVNSLGGKQSKIEGRYDILPHKGIQEVAKVMEFGAKRYSPNNWRKISRADHINHALAHLFIYMRTDIFEELTHAATRVLMAICIPEEEDPPYKRVD